RHRLIELPLDAQRRAQCVNPRRRDLVRVECVLVGEARAELVVPLMHAGQKVVGLTERPDGGLADVDSNLRAVLRGGPAREEGKYVVDCLLISSRAARRRLAPSPPQRTYAGGTLVLHGGRRNLSRDGLSDEAKEVFSFASSDNPSLDRFRRPPCRTSVPPES